MNRNLHNKEARSAARQTGLFVRVSAESAPARSQSQEVKDHNEQHYAGQADHGVPPVRNLCVIF